MTRVLGFFVCLFLGGRGLGGMLHVITAIYLNRLINGKSII